MYTDETVYKHKKFFDLVVDNLCSSSHDGNIIPVLHLLPDAIPFIYALQKIANVPFVIPKPMSVNKTVENEIGVMVRHL